LFFSSSYFARQTQFAEVTALTLEEVSLNFGGVCALNNVSFTLGKRQIVAIIGPNGAGKTCLLNCISGFYRPQHGTIRFGDVELTRLPTDQVSKIGIARTFQNVELYTGMTVLENVMAGRHIHMKTNVFTAALRAGPASREEALHRRVAEEIIDFLEMQSIRKKVVGTLPYGLRKRTELARALAVEPALLLLDEPMTGMNQEEKEDMARFIIGIHQEKGTPIILIEHDMGVVMSISDRVIVMNLGEKLAEGSPAEVCANPMVIQAYLGEEA
jgi:branched-chain amino acid transport system ATP-binding protein